MKKDEHQCFWFLRETMRWKPSLAAKSDFSTHAEKSWHAWECLYAKSGRPSEHSQFLRAERYCQSLLKLMKSTAFAGKLRQR